MTCIYVLHRAFNTDIHFVGGTSSLSTLCGLCSIIVLSTYANIITMSIEAIHESGYKYDVIYPLS